jgi:hypothetical protein
MATAVPFTKPRPRLTEGLRHYFKALVRGTAGGELELREHGGRQHARRFPIPAGTAPRLPEPVVRILEEAASCWAVGVAVRRKDKPVTVSALVVKRGASWPGALAVLPPTVIARASPTVALWALTEPLPAAAAEDQARVLALMHGLAGVVGGTPFPEDLDVGALEVPLPGSLVRNDSNTHVRVSRLTAGAVYDVVQIEAAIAARR